MSKLQCLTCFHKFIDINELITACLEGCDSQYFALSTGITDENFNNLVNQGYF